MRSLGLRIHFQLDSSIEEDTHSDDGEEDESDGEAVVSFQGETILIEENLQMG